MQQIIESDEYISKILLRNNRLFAGTLFWCQVVFIIFYGFFILPQPTAFGQDQDLMIAGGVALLVLVGFGLLFSISKNGAWAGLGFTFLITVVTFQLFFLVSALWSQINVHGQSTTYSWGDHIPVFLTNTNTLNISTYDNTAVHAFKCALANVIAFAAIAGRAGPLQAMIIAVGGTILYQLNRQIIARFCLDLGGSMGIFCFGGMMGTAISVILYQCKQRRSALDHRLKIAGKLSYSLSVIGGLFCWVFFIFLNIDTPTTIAFNYTGGINVLYTISASVLAGVGVSCIYNGKLDLNDFIYCIISGGVIIGSSASIINNSLYALLMGIGSGSFQVLFNSLDRKIRKAIYVDNNVFFVFGIQGLAGGLLSAIFVSVDASIAKFNGYKYPYTLPAFEAQLYSTGIAAGIGLAGGLLLSIPITLINNQKINDHYHDQSYWMMESDGLTNRIDINHNSQESENESSNGVEEQRQIEMQIEQDSEFKNKYAYL